MIVRELITRLGFEVDEASFKAAERKYDEAQKRAAGGGQKPGAKAEAAGKAASEALDKTKEAASDLAGTLGKIGQVLGSLGLSAMLHQFVELASNANETTNALGELFGKEGQADVIAWSKTQAAAMGRSEFDLQSYASRLGSVLGPVTKSREEATKMSETLGGLAVDLASFFNTSDEQAMLALRSGLTGEYESLKRYGVVLNEATMQELAHSKGIKKKVSQMTVAEKTELRYQAIINATKTAQGDAARTGTGFANASKALKAQIRDLGTNMAQTMIPALEKLVLFGRNAVTWFNQMAKDTEVLRAAFIVLGTAALWLGRAMFMSMAIPLLQIGLVILAVDELINLFTGGRTVIGDFLDETFGLGTTDALVTSIADGFDRVGEALAAAWQYLKEFMATAGDMQGLWDMIAGRWMGFGEDMGLMFGDLSAKIYDWLMKPIMDAQHAFAGFMKRFGVDIPEMEGQSYERARGRGVGADAMGDDEFRGARRRERERNRRGGVDARAEAHKNFIEDAALAGLNDDELGIAHTPGTAWTLRRREALKAREAARQKELAADALQSTDPALSAAPVSIPAGPMSTLDAGESALTSAPPVAMGDTVINVSTNDPAVMARVAQQVVDANNKKLAAALPRRGGM